MNTLAQLHTDIEDRVQAIRDDHPDWLCGLGCDGCCHRLAEVPLLTTAEWDLLREGLTALPPEQLREIARDIATMAEQPSHRALLSARYWIGRRALAGSMPTAR